MVGDVGVYASCTAARRTHPKKDYYCYSRVIETSMDKVSLRPLR